MSKVIDEARLTLFVLLLALITYLVPRSAGTMLKWLASIPQGKQEKA